MANPAPVVRDETPMQSAERAASAISAYVAEMVWRAIHDPQASPSAQEKAAFTALRDELHNLASHEYDRGFRRAIALRRSAPPTPEAPDDE